MEIDFHHSTTYVLSRMAGFSPDDAYKIAYSSQYVDDAGTYVASQFLKMAEWHAIFFETFEIFEYIDSSHSMLDISNWKELDQHRVWVPFHFLPANYNLTFEENLVCEKAWISRQPQDDHNWENPLAKDMVDEVVENDRGIFRLGITMHTLADTFAHQGFSGVLCENVNTVKNIKIQSPEGLNVPKTGNFPALGHAEAEHLPDLPFAVWSYKNKDNDTINRDNPADYADAIEIMFQSLNKYRINFVPDGKVNRPKDIKHDMEHIKSLFVSLLSKDGKIRDNEWQTKIAAGEFNCCPEGRNERVEYASENEAGSWWKEVERMCPWTDWKKHPTWFMRGYRKFNNNFMTSNYKLFQDALQSHLYYVSKVLYPKYNLCAL